MNENQTLMNIKTAIDQCDGVTCVYLVATRAGDQCYIKVGRTANLKKRMLNYVQYNPVARLIAYKPTSFMNSFSEERYYHKRCKVLGFKGHKFSKEWCKVTAEEYKIITTEGFNALG